MKVIRDIGRDAAENVNGGKEAVSEGSRVGKRHVLPAAGGIVFVNEVVVDVNCLDSVGEGAAVGQGIEGM